MFMHALHMQKLSHDNSIKISLGTTQADDKWISWNKTKSYNMLTHICTCNAYVEISFLIKINLKTV